uniref:SWIM-type domain-containing protein n=1 Tax=Lactuca sativa TaxID=4236 RepID=A0A9R1WD16_LACSA|nr:hypothetical protein LSAT_V11C200067850 [Lactuca sativa]
MVYNTIYRNPKTDPNRPMLIPTNAYDHLIEREPKSWSKAFFVEGRNCDAMENGVSKSFNNAIWDARRKPIITMLEEIRVWATERMYNQRIMGEEWDLDIFPTIRKDLKDNNITQSFWGVYPSGYPQFEVRFGNDAFDVDLIRRVCECRSWQLRGIPCLHGLAVIAYLNYNAQSYVAHCSSKQSFLSSYTYNVHPLHGSPMWPKIIYQKHLPPKKDYQADQKLKRTKDKRIQYHVQKGCKSVVLVEALDTRNQVFQEKGNYKWKGKYKWKWSGHLPVQESIQEPVQEYVKEPVQAPIKVHVQASIEAPVQAPGASRIGKMHVRKRKVSERITEIGLSKKVVPRGGICCSQNKPGICNKP